MKSLFSIALFLLTLIGLVSPAVSAQLAVKGLLVYHPSGHTDSYIEVIPFNQNSPKNLFDGELVTLGGTLRSYKLEGMIAQIDYPAALGQITVEMANEKLKTINDFLIKYPQEKEKFQHALMTWQAALQVENNRLKNESQSQQQKPDVTGEDITTTTGTKYSNVTINRADPDGLVVMTESGVTKIPFSILSKELQAKYGYDPLKAAKYQEAVQAVVAQRQAEVKALQQKKAAQATVAAESKAFENATVTVEGKVLSVVQNGILLTDVTVTMPVMADVKVKRGVLDEGNYERREVMQTVYSNNVFIFGVTGLVDGDAFSGKVYPAPNYSYTSAMGAAKMVRAFAVSKNLSKSLLQKAE